MSRAKADKGDIAKKMVWQWYGNGMAWRGVAWRGVAWRGEVRGCSRKRQQASAKHIHNTTCVGRHMMLRIDEQNTEMWVLLLDSTRE